MERIIAIAASDFHTHKFRNFNVDNSRLNYTLGAIQEIGKACRKYKVPLLFSGDWYHNPKELENETNTLSLKVYKESFEDNGISVFAISGNHDLCEKNGCDYQSPSHLTGFKIFPNFNLVDRTVEASKDLVVWGIPYMNNDKDVKKYVESKREEVRMFEKDKVKILLLHSDAPGAVTPEGIEVKETEHLPWNLDKFFKEWDLVLFGHIHKPQKLGNKVFMVGSPIHQNIGDSGIDMGYWEVWKTDKGIDMRFKPLNNFPKFIKLKEGEKAADNFNYYIMPEQTLEEENVEVGEFSINQTRDKLAKKYCKLRGIKKKSRIRELISLLNEAE